MTGRPRHQWSIVTIEIVTAALIATLVAWASWTADEAAAHWHTASRAEGKWSAAASEVSRTLFQDEGPRALDVTMAEIRVEQLSLLRSSPGVREEAQASVQYVERLRRALPHDSAVDQQYRLPEPEEGYDLNARLADIRNSDADLVAREVEDHIRAGDAAHDRLRLISIAAVILLVFFVAIGVRATRSPGRVSEDTQELGVDLIPAPWRTPRVRLAAWLAFSAWVLVVLTPLFQLAVDTRAAREDARSTRLIFAVQRDTSILALRSSLYGQGVCMAAAMQQQGRSRADTASVNQQLIGAAEIPTATRFLDALEVMMEPPTAGDELDLPFVRSLNLIADDLSTIGTQQAEAFDLARQLDRAAALIAVSAALAALSATAAAVAVGSRTPGAAPQFVAVSLLIGSVVLCATGVVAALASRPDGMTTSSIVPAASADGGCRLDDSLES